MAPTAAEGMVAGNGEATAISPGAPSSASTGVATEEPPTPNRPVQIPTPTPASTMKGHQARCVIGQTRERALIRLPPRNVSSPSRIGRSQNGRGSAG